MADITKIHQTTEMQIYNKDVQTTPFIKITIPPMAVTIATLAGTFTYSATNASITALSSATEMGINGAGFIVGKTTSAFVSPIIGTSISLSSGLVATSAKEMIQAKGKLVSIATGSLVGAGTAIAVSAGSYLLSGLQTLGESMANALHTWARASEYSDHLAQEQQTICKIINKKEKNIDMQEMEILDEQLILSELTFTSLQEESDKFMEQVKKVAMS
jgi:hypothetical protein